VVVIDRPWLWRTFSKVKVEICKCCLNVSKYRNEHRFSHTNRRETHQKRWKKTVSFIMCFDMSILVLKIQIDTAQNTTIPSVPVQWRQQRQRRISHSQQISHQKCMTRFVTTMKPNERVLCMFTNSGRLMRELSVYQTHPSSVSLPIRHWLRVRSRIRHLVLEMYWLRLHTAFCSVTGNVSMIIADFLFRQRF